MYLIKMADVSYNGYSLKDIKIGISTNILGRIKKYQTGLSNKVELCGMWSPNSDIKTNEKGLLWLAENYMLLRNGESFLLESSKLSDLMRHTEFIFKKETGITLGVKKYTNMHKIEPVCFAINNDIQKKFLTNANDVMRLFDSWNQCPPILQWRIFFRHVTECLLSHNNYEKKQLVDNIEWLQFNSSNMKKPVALIQHDLYIDLEKPANIIIDNLCKLADFLDVNLKIGYKDEGVKYPVAWWLQRHKWR